jgi:leader peptidase (prepilin peptidase)/N-methyltransferase
MLSITIGGFSGTIINMLASRLPADGDLPAFGLPLRPGSGTPDPFGFFPFLGAFITEDRRVDWPKLATEFGAAAIVAISLARYDWSLAGLRAAAFSLILLLILRIDWQNHLIFTVTIVPALALAFGLQALDSPRTLFESALASVIAAGVFLALFVLALAIYKQRALGFGDILLAALIGAMAADRTLAAILLGMILGGFGGLFLVAIRLRTREDFIPYGAWLCLGAMIVLL